MFAKKEKSLYIERKEYSRKNSIIEFFWATDPIINFYLDHSVRGIWYNPKILLSIPRY